MEREIEGGYTPGPWVLSQPIIRGVTTMYWVNVNTSIGSNKLEDARLIAAAPELLEALQTIVRNSYVGKAGQTVSFRSKWANYPAADHHKAVAAIAKALGTGDAS